MGQGGRMYSWCWSSQSRSSQMVFLLGNMPLCDGANMLGSYCFCAAITKCSYSPRTAAHTHPHVQSLDSMSSTKTDNTHAASHLHTYHTHLADSSVVLQCALATVESTNRHAIGWARDVHSATTDSRVVGESGTSCTYSPVSGHRGRDATTIATGGLWNTTVQTRTHTEYRLCCACLLIPNFGMSQFWMVALAEFSLCLCLSLSVCLHTTAHCYFGGCRGGLVCKQTCHVR